MISVEEISFRAFVSSKLFRAHRFVREFTLGVNEGERSGYYSVPEEMRDFFKNGIVAIHVAAVNFSWGYFGF